MTRTSASRRRWRSSVVSEQRPLERIVIRSARALRSPGAALPRPRVRLRHSGDGERAGRSQGCRSGLETKEKRQRRPVSRVLFSGCLPGAAVISLGRRLPGASSGHTREPHAGRASPALASGIALLFGLAPGGVCRAGPVTRAAGELLPHRFTLTARRASPPAGWRFAFCGTVPWGRPPWPLASTLPSGARTFLPRESPRAGDRPAFSGAIKELSTRSKV